MEDGEVEGGIRRDLWELDVARPEKSVGISLSMEVHILGGDRCRKSGDFIFEECHRPIISGWHRAYQ